LDNTFSLNFLLDNFLGELGRSATQPRDFLLVESVLNVLLLDYSLEQLFLSVDLFQLRKKSLVHIPLLLQCTLKLHLTLESLFLIVEHHVILLQLVADLLLQALVLIGEIQPVVVLKSITYGNLSRC